MWPNTELILPTLVALVSIGAIYYFYSTFCFIFFDTSTKPKPTPTPSTPLEAAKLYLSKYPYTCLDLKKGKYLAKDVGQDIILPFETASIDSNIGGIIKILNNGGTKFTVETSTEYDHHIVVELLYLLLPLLNRQLDFDSTTLLKKKSPTSKLFVSECQIK